MVSSSKETMRAISYLKILTSAIGNLIHLALPYSDISLESLVPMSFAFAPLNHNVPDPSLEKVAEILLDLFTNGKLIKPYFRLDAHLSFIKVNLCCIGFLAIETSFFSWLQFLFFFFFSCSSFLPYPIWLQSLFQKFLTLRFLFQSRRCFVSEYSFFFLFFLFWTSIYSSS